MTFLRKSGDRDARTAARPDPTGAPARLMEIDEFRASLDAWLDEHAAALAPDAGATRPWTTRWPSSPRSSGSTYDAGWMRWGWPTRVGGLGGSTLLRAYLGEALTATGPGRAGPLLDDRGPGPDHDRLRHPELAAAMVPRCYAATRPGARVSRSPGPAATWPPSPAGPRGPARSWRVTGQKVWTSLAQYADRCVLLTRTGEPDSAHKGITALFVDMDSPASPSDRSRRCTALPEFSEVFFDDVARALRPHPGRGGSGLVGGHGPASLRAEHGAVASRVAYLHRRLRGLLEAVARRQARSRRGGRGRPTPLRPSGPVPGHPVPPGGR